MRIALESFKYVAMGIPDIHYTSSGSLHVQNRYQAIHVHSIVIVLLRELCYEACILTLQCSFERNQMFESP